MDTMNTFKMLGQQRLGAQWDPAFRALVHAVLTLLFFNVVSVLMQVQVGNFAKRSVTLITFESLISLQNAKSGDRDTAD